MKWISVKERLPEFHKVVLGINSTGKIGIISLYNYSPSTAEKEWDHYHDYGYRFDSSIITHWMPLPEAPEENQ